MRAGEEAEAVQILPRHHVDQHHVPGQQHGAGDALPVPSQLGGLPGEAASLPDGLWPWLPVQLCLLPADGEFFFCQLPMRVKRDVVLALFLWAKVMPISTTGKTFLFACPTFFARPPEIRSSERMWARLAELLPLVGTAFLTPRHYQLCTGD